MIIVKIQAGLGNQLFSYAAAWALQQKTGEKVYAIYDIDGEKTGRKLSITNTCVEMFPQCPKLMADIIYKWKKWEQILKRRDLSSYNDAVKAFEDGFCCTPIRRYINADMSKARIKYLSGTFQSRSYFELSCSSNQIREMFRIRESQSPENVKVQKLILQTRDSVCLHIRLGDYMWEKYKRFQVCTEKYYKAAIRRMISELDMLKTGKSAVMDTYEDAMKPCFFVFSENQDIVRTWNLEEVCENRATIEYVDLGNPDYEELRLMYSCEHFILSNSTFSWWAQYLAQNIDKIVIAPNRWMNDDNNAPIDLIDNNWILLNI